MSHIEIVRNDLPKLIRDLPSVVASRLTGAVKDARGASQKAVDEAGEPSSDSGALREGQAIQTARENDFEAVKATARAAFVGNPSRFDPKGKFHTTERFEELCGEVEALPSPRNKFEVVAALTILMMYGAWWEDGDAWDLTRREKRPATPWFRPAINAWGADEFASHFEGSIQEALRS